MLSPPARVVDYRWLSLDVPSSILRHRRVGYIASVRQLAFNRFQLFEHSVGTMAFNLRRWRGGFGPAIGAACRDP